MPATVAQTVAAEVAGAGVDRVFRLPGGEVLHLLDALRRAGGEFTLSERRGSRGSAPGPRKSSRRPSAAPSSATTRS
jgi:thiamine pyrophosphate-dependent acetolactate synthase large subunit-like protein